MTAPQIDLVKGSHRRVKPPSTTISTNTQQSGSSQGLPADVWMER